MFFTIITTTLNSAKTIEANIKSVQKQTFKDYEQIIIDGYSNDNTIELINSLATSNRVHVAKKNILGLYSAFNYGLELSKGKYVIFLNSDDHFNSDSILESVFNHMNINNFPDILYGDINYFSKSKLIRSWKSGKYNFAKLKFGWSPPHTSLFVSSKLIKLNYRFNTNYKISADYEYILSILHNPNFKVSYIEKVIANMNYGGASTKLVNLIKIFKEDYLIARSFFKIPILTVILKKTSKIKQFL